MLLILSGDVDSSMLSQLVEAINQFRHDHNGQNDKIDIYLNSTGGDVNVMYAMIDMINAHKEYIHLIGYGSLYSAAFFIFFGVNCPRKILPGTIAMCHYIRATIEVGGPIGYSPVDKILQRWATSQNEWVIEFCQQIGMNQKEIAAIKKTEEVYIHTDRLNDLLDKQSYGR